MLIDARTLTSKTTLEADICIVGAGVAGIGFAKEFMGTKTRLCLLESGGARPDRETQSLYWGQNIGLPYYELDKSRARFLGGTSHFWHIPIGKNQLGVRLRGHDPIDFEKRDWVPYSGWPFGISELEPYYRKAHDLCQIGAYSYRPADWMSAEHRHPVHFTGPNLDTTIFHFGNREIFFKDYLDQLERSDNIKVFTHANCVNIDASENAQTVKKLDVACLNGLTFHVEAKAYILAAGGIEVPRLLLLSNQVQKEGLGNGSDCVGRFFMEHPHLWSGTFIPANPHISNTTGLYKIYRVGDVPVMGKLTLKAETLRKERLLNYTVSIHPNFSLSYKFHASKFPPGVHSAMELRSALKAREMPDGFFRHSLNVIKDFRKVVAAAIGRPYVSFQKDYAAGKQIIVYRLNHMAEQHPNPESRVMLDDEKDALGQNRIKLRWKLTAQDIDSMIRSQRIIDQDLRRNGLGRLSIDMEGTQPPEDIHGGWHHMGTTRMHVDPKWGVVDAHCRVHGISNLFIAGSSVFPTGGYANPVLTTLALTIRLADHIKNFLK
jgi:choline dehydrogenase-like flavoprotein